MFFFLFVNLIKDFAAEANANEFFFSKNKFQSAPIIRFVSRSEMDGRQCVCVCVCVCRLAFESILECFFASDWRWRAELSRLSHVQTRTRASERAKELERKRGHLGLLSSSRLELFAYTIR